STDLTSSIQLPTAAPMGSSIAWSSSHPEIISNTGEVTRPTSGDVEVSLTATLVHEALTDSKTFQFIVWEADAVAYQIEIDADQPLYEVNPTLFGLFYEDINYAGDGGLYG